MSHHKTETIPPSVTSWWDDRGVREAVVAFVTGFLIALVAVLAVLGVI